eukprot:758265-Hanusia_phi.AAC.2
MIRCPPGDDSSVRLARPGPHRATESDGPIPAMIHDPGQSEIVRGPAAGGPGGRRRGRGQSRTILNHSLSLQ